jgi:hypothetical protein
MSIRIWGTGLLFVTEKLPPASGRRRAAQPQPGPFSAPPGMYLFMFLLVFLPLFSVFLWALFSFIR